jgi:hypothetical protein
LGLDSFLKVVLAEPGQLAFRFNLAVLIKMDEIGVALPATSVLSPLLSVEELNYILDSDLKI